VHHPPVFPVRGPRTCGDYFATCFSVHAKQSGSVRNRTRVRWENNAISFRRSMMRCSNRMIGIRVSRSRYLESQASSARLVSALLQLSATTIIRSGNSPGSENSRRIANCDITYLRTPLFRYFSANALRFYVTCFEQLTNATRSKSTLLCLSLSLSLCQSHDGE